jgi:hypothetical protein
MTMVKIHDDTLQLGELAIRFQRTLRIPDDGRTYPLPPGLGSFPLRKVDDYADRVPREWLERGGVFLPMYQREAMWLSFSRTYWKPCALKVGIGKVCALTGERWSESLHEDPQDYLVTGPQPWLDGISVGKGKIRQFVAMPLGMGYTVEGQVTGEERFGGIQLKVFEPKPGRFKEPPPVAYRTRADGCFPPPPMSCAAPPAPGCARPSAAASMGLGAGGKMEQKIYPDPHGIDTWSRSDTLRVFVHIVNTELWREITGERPPQTPVTAKEYARHGFPWFSLYDESAPALSGTETLRRVKTIREIDEDKSSLPLQDDTPVEPGPVKKLWFKLTGGVRDGNW